MRRGYHEVGLCYGCGAESGTYVEWFGCRREPAEPYDASHTPGFLRCICITCLKKSCLCTSCTSRAVKKGRAA
jgi:hypothetical protein